MPIVVTSGDVAFYDDLTRRLRAATAALDQAATELAGLLSGVTWSGSAATAGREEARRLARRLRGAGTLLGALSGRAAATLHALTDQLASRRALESSVLGSLDRIVRLPGDIEADARSLLHEVPLAHTLRHLLP